MRSRPRLPAAPPDTISLYVRLSRMADEKNLSLDGMTVDVKALAADLGLRIVGLHVDDGLSGAIRDRPEFVAWLDDARECRASVLGAFHVDRMTREGVNVAALILDAIEGKDPVTGSVVRAPVRLVDTKGLDSAGDETSFRLQFVIKAEIARAERERMRERSRDRVRRARAAGRFPGGTANFGLRVIDNPDGPGRVLEIHPEEAAILRRGAERLVADEMSRMAIIRAANRECVAAGVSPRRTSSFSRATFFQALRSENVRALIFTPAENRAIAQALKPKRTDHRHTKGGRPKGGRQPSRLLSGVLRCKGCGAKLTVSPQEGRKVKYRCTSIGTGTACPSPVTVTCEYVEEYVTSAWLDGWGRIPETVTVRPVDEAADKLAEILDAIETEAALVVQARGAERLEALARLEELEARRDELEAEPVSTLTVLQETGKTYAEVWAEGELADCRELLLRTVGSLTVGPAVRKDHPRGFNPARIVDAWRLDPAQVDARAGL